MIRVHELGGPFARITAHTMLSVDLSTEQRSADEVRPLQSGFLSSADIYPDRPALEVSGQRLTYNELLDFASRIAATLQDAASAEPTLTAIYAYRTPVLYASILGTLLRGHGYVPLNPRFPHERNRLALRRVKPRTIIVDSEGEKTLPELIDGLDDELTILLPHRPSISEWQQRWPQHLFLGCDDLAAVSERRPVLVDLDSVAYVLFTSGSTGEPKGVMITHRNVAHLLRTMVARYGMNESDRVSQFADPTFDPSVFDIFAAWECGACVCSPDSKELLNPARFLTDGKITIFQTVPSNGLLLRRLGVLKAGRFPHLRLTLFGGEALPKELCEEWQLAAPNSIIENLYGPTELTINSTAYRWDVEHSPDECENGIVPIGSLLRNVRGLVVDAKLREVPDGEQGELLLAGPQRTPGYINDPGRTERVLVMPEGKDETYYRTGDSVKRPVGKDYYVFCGRIDFQIKIFGMRIELGEVEAALREASGVAEVAAIGWPITPAGAGGIVGFVGKCDSEPQQLKQALQARLPRQMAPREIRVLEKLPLNTNGKVDRLALRQLLEVEA